MKNLLYQIALTQLPMVGNVNAKKLIAYCGSSEDVFKNKYHQLIKIPGVGTQIAKAITQSATAALKRAEQEIAFIEREQIQAFFFLDDDYPKRLKHCEDAPVMLYHRGNSNFENQRCIAIVGTRKASEYGKRLTEKLVSDLIPYQPLVVSGLAYGIDICAHRAAIKNNLQTVAVFAHGLDMVYPPQHKNTAVQMVSNGGLLTDYPSATNPDRENFPSRNRIVAGLVDAVLVVEAGAKGGALITAEIAASYNRDVLAFPGRIDDVYSAGCNKLIKQNKAALIEDVNDLAYACGWELQEKKKLTQNRLFIDFTPDEQIVVEVLREQSELVIDDLSMYAKITMGKLSGILLSLELKNVVKSLPGKVYTLAH
jgi:DNA processing protein